MVWASLRGVGECGRGQAPLLRGGRGPRLRGVGNVVEDKATDQDSGSNSIECPMKFGQ